MTKLLYNKRAQSLSNHRKYYGLAYIVLSTPLFSMNPSNEHFWEKMYENMQEIKEKIEDIKVFYQKINPELISSVNIKMKKIEKLYNSVRKKIEAHFFKDLPSLVHDDASDEEGSSYESE